MRLAIFAIALMLGEVVLGSPQRAFKGRVISVADGDTITVLSGKRSVRVRLHGIDAPESRQPFGAKSRQFLRSLALGKDVFVAPRGTGLDRYGRFIGEVTLATGRSVNLESLTAGMSWWYRVFAPDDERLKTAESKARLGKRGLWADSKPIAPWEFRAAKRGRTLDIEVFRIWAQLQSAGDCIGAFTLSLSKRSTAINPLSGLFVVQEVGHAFV